MKFSFIAAFDVTANNGTTISIAPRSLIIMFVFMLADTVLISLAIFFVHAIFSDIRTDCTPFTRRNTLRIKIIAVIAAVLSMVGSYSDALVDYYAICAAAHMAGWPSGRSMPGIWSYYIISEPAWKINIAGLVMALIIY